MAAHIIVIGSGIAGSAIAFALARRGSRVTIVDNGTVGQATAASAGIVAPWGSQVSGPLYELYAAGGDYYPAVLEQLADAGITRTSYRRTGALTVNHDPEKLNRAEELLRRRAAQAGSVAGEVQRLSPAEARALFPALSPELEAVLITGGGRVDGRILRDALLAGAERHGARRVTGSAQIKGEDVFVDDVEYRADGLVLAAGAWTNEILKRSGTKVPVAPQRGQITHLRVEGSDTSSWPSIHPLSHHYVVAFNDGRVAVGATRETGSGFDPRVTASGQLQVLQDALRIVPGLADATLLETRVGLRPLSENQLPVVGKLPGQSKLWVATGYGAAGLTMAPLLGDLLAQAILGDTPPELDALKPEPTTCFPYTNLIVNGNF